MGAFVKRITLKHKQNLQDGKNCGVNVAIAMGENTIQLKERKKQQQISWVIECSEGGKQSLIAHLQHLLSDSNGLRRLMIWSPYRHIWVVWKSLLNREKEGVLTWSVICLAALLNSGDEMSFIFASYGILVNSMVPGKTLAKTWRSEENINCDKCHGSRVASESLTVKEKE